MFGASGYVVPAGGNHQHSMFAAAYPKPSFASPFVDALENHHQYIKSHNNKEKNFVDISMDLLQYMSEGLEAACNSLQAACQPQATACCPLDAYPSLGSGCSAHSNQMEPESPTYKQHTQQSPASSPSSSSSTCHTDAGPTPASSTPSSSSSSAGSADMEQQLKASSCQSYDDNFVWQCYFGDPNSAVNKQQQRPKQVSPFAAFATFPGYSL